jgi:hypothetical protein
VVTPSPFTIIVSHPCFFHSHFYVVHVSDVLPENPCMHTYIIRAYYYVLLAISLYSYACIY